LPLPKRPEGPRDIEELKAMVGDYDNIKNVDRVVSEELRRILALPGSGPFLLRRRGDDLVLVMEVKTLSVINVRIRRLNPDCANCVETDCPDRQAPMVTRG
jgi:hypothetical protein